MGFTALERFLTPERVRQRAGRSGFATPALQEVSVGVDTLPLLATNMRGTFVYTARHHTSIARYGFTDCTVEEEGRLLAELYRVLSVESVQQKWPTRCKSIPEATQRLRAGGLEPKFMIISEALLPEILGVGYDIESVRRSMDVQGFVAVVDGMQVLLADLPANAALVTAQSAAVGLYTRVGDRLGILLQRVNRSVMVVDRELA